jgi:uncharacterized protein YjbI with pentapeptide repeats
MKPQLLTVIVLISAIAAPVQAENLSNLNQLLGTKKCPQCDLSNAGLVQADLMGSHLVGANLTDANLSQANLKGADLRGANLSGTSLYGANLTGANLRDANLTGTDLRNAYVDRANLTGVDLESAHVDGIKGLAASAASAEQFHRWGVREAESGNYQGAIANYHKAIQLDPELAPAYLGLAIIQYNFDYRGAAQNNTQMAINLFKKQKHELGLQTATNFQQKMTLIQEAENNVAKQGGGHGQVGKFMGSIGSFIGLTEYLNLPFNLPIALMRLF